MSEDKQPQPENAVEGEVESSQAAESPGTDSNDAQETSDIERIAELEAELAAANAKVDGQKDSVLRARAEMENARRRADAEVEKARKFALEKFAGELLPVIDNLERALQVADADHEAVKPLVEGVDLTLKSFVSTIDKFGLKIIDPQGESFNPELHQAMSIQESADVPANTVIAVMQKGYELNGRLLRPAMVMVSRAPDGGVDTQV